MQIQSLELELRFNALDMTYIAIANIYTGSTNKPQQEKNLTQLMINTLQLSPMKLFMEGSAIGTIQ